MSHVNSFDPALTRRGFLGGSAAAMGLGLLPKVAKAAYPKFRRYDVTDPSLPSHILPSYRAAVTAMLGRDPDDPRNWYRNALVHFLDCPHGNWWFLPWHRGYVGWLEQTCRELSGDYNFSLPYWDWTKTPRVPEGMFNGMLDPNDPTSPGYIPTFDEFRMKFEPAVQALYASFSQEQNDQLAIRGITTAADLLNFAAVHFFSPPDARGLTPADPDLDTFTQGTVAIDTIRSALRVPVFSESTAPGFASGMTTAHSNGTGQGILESQPHNNVHGAVGGFMGRFLSPVDPIFFLHHGNIDRLWDVWTRRQTALQRPTLPEGADLTAWSEEPFLFFSDASGQPVKETKAGDYAEMSVFGYDYAPGSGEDEVPVAVAAAPPAAPTSRTAVAMTATPAVGEAAGGMADVPSTALAAAAVPTAAPAIAEVTLNLTAEDMGRRFKVLVTPPGASEPIVAGAITVFGRPHHDGPQTFAVPLPAAEISAATAAAAAETVSLDIRVEEVESAVGARRAAAEVSEPAPVVSIEVTTG
jgi:hypothetical protein